MIRQGPEGAQTHIHETIVIGSGPAGLTLAMELARRGRPTLVLESGVDRPSAAQDLSIAEIADPARHDDPRFATSRRLGGTSNLWGGRSVPLDPVDFDARPYVGGARWPISYDELAPHYETACRYVGCGEAAFTLAVPGLAAADGDFKFDAIERASNRPSFQKAHAATLAASKLIDIRLGATVVAITFAENGRATGVVVATEEGRRLRISAARVVLAAGGLEFELACCSPRNAGGRMPSAAPAVRLAAITWDTSSARSPTSSLPTCASRRRLISCATGATRSSAAASPPARR